MDKRKRRSRNKTDEETVKPRHKPKGFLHEVDSVPVYRRFDRDTQQTAHVAYFNDWCVAQIGMTWDDAMENLLDFRYGYTEIEEYWLSLRKDFYDWTAARGLSGRRVHMYPEKQKTARRRHSEQRFLSASFDGRR